MNHFYNLPKHVSSKFPLTYLIDKKWLSANGATVTNKRKLSKTTILLM